MFLLYYGTLIRLLGAPYIAHTAYQLAGYFNNGRLAVLSFFYLFSVVECQCGITSLSRPSTLNEVASQLAVFLKVAGNLDRL
jgi:hypothetical protein